MKKILNIYIPVERIDRRVIKIRGEIGDVMKDLISVGLLCQHAPSSDEDIIILASDTIEFEERIKVEVLNAAQRGIPVYSIFQVSDPYVSNHVRRVIPMISLEEELKKLHGMYAKERPTFEESFRHS